MEVCVRTSPAIAILAAVVLWAAVPSQASAKMSGAPDIFETAPFQLLKKEGMKLVDKTIEQGKKDITEATERVCRTGSPDECGKMQEAQRRVENVDRAWRFVKDLDKKIEENPMPLSPSWWGQQVTEPAPKPSEQVNY
jgi:hypothetical protein